MGKRESDWKEGAKAGIPIFIGYFPTAIAYGLLCKQALLFWETVATSAFVYGGSSQFLAMNLLIQGATLAGYAVPGALVNLRYTFEGAALARRLDPSVRGLRRLFCALMLTDESFTAACLKKGPVTWSYLVPLQLVSWSGWVSGTAVGWLVGSLLSPRVQLAVGVTIYAMFACLWGGEIRKGGAVVFATAAISGAANSVLVLLTPINPGWAFVISMIGATLIGAALPGRQNSREEEEA